MATVLAVDQAWLEALYSYDPPKDLHYAMWSALVLSPLCCRGENRGTERLSNLAKEAQPGSDGAGRQTQALLSSVLALSPAQQGSLWERGTGKDFLGPGLWQILSPSMSATVGFSTAALLTFWGYIIICWGACEGLSCALTVGNLAAPLASSH